MAKLALLSVCLVLLTCDAGAESPAERPAPRISRPTTPTTSVAPRAVETLQNDRAVSVALLRRGLDARRYDLRLFATEALRNLPTREATALLAAQLGDPEADIRIAAVIGLGGLRGRRACQLLRSVRDDEAEDLAVRILATTHLLSPKGPCQ